MYLLEGEISGHYEGEPDFLIKPNEFFLFDATKPSRLRFDKNRMILLDLPRSQMQSLFTGSTPSPVLIGKALSHFKLAPMLRMQLEQFSKLAGDLNDKEKLTLLDATEAFAMTIIEGACADIQKNYQGSHQGLVTAARHYIQLNLGDPNLNAQRIASALGCSRATLYRAFFQFDLSIAEFIRELRLRQLQRLLLDPEQHLTIAQLAYRCGFFDSFNIHRLYKKRFGITPSEQRKRG
ncbi:helix-turn-helix domain-containing protein [Alcaligenes endophyticus]|uniref:Helix-turn-helix domain-containing protein n=1 Tax=Alcaligenes endophyticus TaxID=1929088 RepID=A0ABT8EGC9_9BURK|nr:helix-turn-helix domain-containing protein [Alcaligenes endophyticus]MCX5589992.1 helix-turn-helix domain-containing protein [Alcaligenes endophyticus]MDN4120345.1 helix-turn-helix domain-containing protein [Alcaligenes endophyticus]